MHYFRNVLSRLHQSSGDGVDLNVNLYILRYTGLWYGPNVKLRPWFRILYGFRTIWMIISLFCVIVFGISAAFMYPKDLITIASNFCICLQGTGAFIKAVFMVSNRGGLQRIMDRLDALSKDPVMIRGGAVSRHIVALSARKAMIVSTIFLVSGLVTFIAWMLTPAILGTGLDCWADLRRAQAAKEIHPERGFFRIVMDSSRNYENRLRDTFVNNSFKEYDLLQRCPIPYLPAVVWFPFDFSRIPGYTLAYLLVIMCGFYMYIITSTIDTFFVSMMIFISSQIRVLASDIRSLRSRSIQDRRKERFFRNSSIDVENEIETERCLTDAINYHQNIIRSVEEIQTIISAPVLVQFTVSITVMCTALYATAKTLDSNYAAAVKFGSYLCTLFAEILLYCWFGEELKQTTDELVLAAYGCDWFEGSREFRKRIHFIIMRSQRTLILRGGAFYDLSLNTFVNIVNASYSVFNLLMRAS